MPNNGRTKINLGSLAQWARPSAAELARRRAQTRWNKVRAQFKNMQTRKLAAKRRLLNLVKSVKRPSQQRTPTPKRASPKRASPRRTPTPRRSPAKVFEMYVPAVNWTKFNRNAEARWRNLTQRSRSVRKN